MAGKNYDSNSFQIAWNMIVETVFLSIMNQMEFHLVQKIERKTVPTIISRSILKKWKYSFLSEEVDGGKKCSAVMFMPRFLEHGIMTALFLCPPLWGGTYGSYSGCIYSKFRKSIQIVIKFKNEGKADKLMDQTVVLFIQIFGNSIQDYISDCGFLYSKFWKSRQTYASDSGLINSKFQKSRQIIISFLANSFMIY